MGLDALEDAGWRFSVSRRAGFWIVAYLFTVAMLGNTLPTPLYVIYQAK